MGKKSVANPPKKSTPSSSKNLGVSKPAISKKPAGKGKKGGDFEILYVKSDSSGRQYGCSSMDSTHYILAPSSVSRADGDLDKDSHPSSPRNDATNKFTLENPYVFYRALKFRFQRAKTLRIEHGKKCKWPIPLLFPDIGALKELDVYDEIRSLLGNSGLSFLFHDDPSSYHEVTFEFLFSFSPVIKINDKGEEKITCWKFSLGDYVWEIDSEVLCDWFRLPRDGWFPRVIDEQAISFGKKLTDKDYTKEKFHKSTSIKFPKWKIIHRFLAGIIFVRSMYRRMVNKLVMMVMMMIEKGEKIDWLWCITQGLLENQVTSSINRGLEGGSIVTLIARKLNYTFDEGGELDKVKLDRDRMRHMYILGKGLKWKVKKESDSEEEEDEVEAELDRNQADGQGIPSD